MISLIHNIFGFVTTEILLLMAPVVMLVLGAFRHGISHHTALKSSIVIILGALFLTFSLFNMSNYNLEAFLVNDKLTLYFKILILFCGLANIFLANEWLILKKFKRYEYPFFLIFSIAGMMIAISAKGFITLYLGLELSMLPMYLMVAFKRRATRSTIMGTRFLAIGLVVAIFYLYGVSFIYGTTGGMGFKIVSEYVSKNGNNALLMAGFFMVIASLLFKCDMAMFNFGSINIAEGAPTPVTSFLLSTPKIAYFVVLLRLIKDVFLPLWPQLMPVLMFFAAASMLLGSIAMISQTNIKRMMAYCSMVYSGYIWASFIGIKENDLSAVVFLVTSYSISIVGIFSIVLSLRKNGNLIENIADVKGFASSHPFGAIVLVCFMMSLSGVPALAGFYGIFHLLMILLKTKIYWLIVCVVISLVLMLLSFIRIIDVVYFKKTDEKFDNIGLYNSIVMICSFFVMLLVCAYPFLLPN
ncbi:MAG: NADH-quinone oxidoreductase subunit N [Alphaproteobacteria bacterium]